MTEPTPVCPKCGAHAVTFGHPHNADRWSCDSARYYESGGETTTRFLQADRCRIRELERVLESAYKFLGGMSFTPACLPEAERLIQEIESARKAKR